MPTESSWLCRGLAWSVHLFTGCGVICCLLALEATYASQWRAALAWLVVAVIIDSADGTLARLAKVKQVTPGFDGALLDNLIDYANYVIVPALIIHRAALTPPGVSFWVACAICLASAYQFCQAGAKTADHYFTGFPSYWNIVALYLLSMGLSRQSNLIIVGVLALLVFIPVKYIYVTRTKVLSSITWPLTILWSATMLAILWQLPSPSRGLVWISLLYVVYYVSASVYLTWRTRRQTL